MNRRIVTILCAAVALWMPSFARAFAVAPASLDLSADPGATIEQTIGIINNGTAEQTYYLGTLPFVPGESSGAPQFLSSDSDRSGFSGWISFPVSSLTVPAQTKVDVPFVVTVPSDAEPGTRYVAVTASTAPSEVVATNGASVEAKLAVLVFLTVSGETVEASAVLDFVSPDSGLVASHAVSYAFRVQNQGNVSVTPEATIVARDAFGREVFRVNANPDGGRVLPKTTRTFSGELVRRPEGLAETLRTQASLFAIGPMKATLVVNGAEAGAVWYWQLPWQLIVAVVGGASAVWLIWRGLTVSRKNRGAGSTST